MNTLTAVYLWLISRPIFAADADIVNKVTSVLTDIMGKVKGVATPIAVLAAIFCGIKLIVASDPQGVKAAKSALITIVVALLIIYLAEPFVNTVIDIVG